MFISSHIIYHQYFQVLAISAQIKSEKESVEALVQPLENADRLFQEIVSNQKQIEDLEYKLDFRGHGVKTMQEIQSELSSLQSTKYVTFLFSLDISWFSMHNFFYIFPFLYTHEQG